eukprot:Nitzschia sp. Nitz4//scaffold84_size84139//40957//43015//NITZ4_005198-RA/size84139-augustus-gene-0.39-mRNA-1//1//CDS//3329559033//273//frame0
MAKAALRRRRGTKSRQGFFADAPLLKSLVVAMVLLVTGLLGGLIIGLFTLATPETKEQALEKLTHLRGHMLDSRPHVAVDSGASVVAAKRAALPPPSPRAGSGNLELDGQSLQARKELYLAHSPEIATKGAFPYYPSGNAATLVEPTHDFSNFQPPGGGRFDEYKHGDSPYSYKQGESDDLARSRRYHVKQAMQFAWKAYEQYAFGMDELKPVSMGGVNGWGGFGTTLVDSLDTLWLMGMKDEFQRARDWVQNSLDHNRDRMVSVFETTIRSLGGLLSAYDWSGDDAFLQQAHDLGKRLFVAVEKNEMGIPYGQVNLANGAVHNIAWVGNMAMTAEFGTLQLEFRMLARLTGNHDFKTKVERPIELLRDMNPDHGLYPYLIRNTQKNAKPEFGNSKLTFGAMSDSFYEYLLKVWLQGGKTEPMYREMYDRAIQGMHDQLLQVSSPSGLVFIADENSGRLDQKMDHLVCFMGGLLALGAYTDPQGLDSERAQRDLKSGKALTYTCYQMYARMATGISPEFIQFHEGNDFDVGAGAPHYLLRPEAVESFFVLYHLTGDPVYREWGWEVFQAIERYCKTTAGYGQLRDVRNKGVHPDDKMESFFLAETMKYLYLLFDPDTPIDLLNKHVFNTEAHPVRTFPAMDAAGVKNLLSS